MQTRRQCGDQRVDFRGRLRCCRAGAQPGDGCEWPRLGAEHQPIPCRRRGRPRGCHKSPGQDADDRHRPTGRSQRAAENLCAAVELHLPALVREDGDTCAHPGLFCRHVAPDRRRHAEYVQQIHRRVVQPEGRHLVVRAVDAETFGECHNCRWTNRCETTGLFNHRWRKPSATFPGLTIAGPELDKLIGFRKRQGPKQHTVHRRESRDVDADANGKHRQGPTRKRLGPPEGSECIPHVRHKHVTGDPGSHAETNHQDLPCHPPPAPAPLGGLVLDVPKHGVPPGARHAHAEPPHVGRQPFPGLASTVPAASLSTADLAALSAVMPGGLSWKYRRAFPPRTACGSEKMDVR